MRGHDARGGVSAGRLTATMAGPRTLSFPASAYGMKVSRRAIGEHDGW
jgi:hypothetical protein